LSNYTPINEYKLSREAQATLLQYKKMAIYSVSTLYAPKKFYEELLNSISPSSRQEFVDAIPFMGKIIVKMR
jgi:hypothetical protein